MSRMVRCGRTFAEQFGWPVFGGKATGLQPDQGQDELGPRRAEGRARGGVRPEKMRFISMLSAALVEENSRQGVCDRNFDLSLRNNLTAPQRNAGGVFGIQKVPVLRERWID
ncbi:MAG TPA: hypothetical protein K8W01_05220 [Methylorubrum populi]|uniref:Uncharacterized protein n=1 Tax=Methylorubrum populi TaxID=223967 RepID=A0A921E0L3_9HYPH|nr:hypothetical protein [Methylorubrum populi]